SLHGIAARHLVDHHARCWPAVHRAGAGIGRLAQLYPGCVGRGRQRATGLRFNDELLEFFFRVEVASGENGGLEHVIRLLRARTPTTARHAEVLFLYGGVDISRREVEIGQLIGIEPYPHTEGLSERHHITYTIYPHQRIAYVEVGVVVHEL